MTSYWSEFLLVALAHLVAVASPGPDFAMVLRQSITYGRRPAIWTSVGIGTGIFLHVAYSLLGIGLLVRSSVLAFNILKWLGAVYLAWIGQKALRAKPFANEAAPNATVSAVPAGGARETPGRRAAFVAGFLTSPQSQGHAVLRGAFLGRHQPADPGADPERLWRMDGAGDDGLVHTRVAFLLPRPRARGLPALRALV